jgi:hypothetical protein
MKTPENIVTLYMKALGNAKLSEKTWKRLAKVNQLILEMKV